MKVKVEVTISVVLMVVILATIISLSFAWFSASNPTVFANNGQMTAAEYESADSHFKLFDGYIRYGGETGLDMNRSELDYPFKSFYTFTVTFKPLSLGSCVTNDISSASIKLRGETEPSFTSEATPEILKNFSWDLYLVEAKDTTKKVNESYSFYPAWELKEEGEEWYYKDENGTATLATADYELTHYYPSECFGKDDEIVRDIDGNPISLPIGSREYTFVIEITFLDRDSYCLHCSQTGLVHPSHENSVSTIKEFAYCDPSYMNSMFSLGIDIGFIKPTPTVVEGIN